MAARERIDELAARLGIAGNADKAELAGYVLSDAEELVKNYCRLDRIPEGLSGTVLRIAAELYRMGNPGEEASAVGAVKSLSEGSLSVSFRPVGAVSENERSEHPGLLLLRDYTAQLNRFRKAGW